MLSIKYSDIHLDLENNRKNRYSTLYAVTWRTRYGEEPAILKMNHDRKQSQEEKEYLLDARHAHVVELYGVIQYGSFKDSLLFEFMSEGDLGVYLNRNNLSELQCTSIAIHILEAVLYLEVVKIAHRDITCNNILVSILSDKTLTAKLADFGIARRHNVAGGYQSTSCEPAGTPGYIAPELFQCNEKKGPCLYNSATEVFSVAIVLLMLGRKNLSEPYPMVGNAMKLSLNSTGTLPIITDEVPLFTREMFTLASKREPKERIDTKTLLEKYQEHKQKLRKK